MHPDAQLFTIIFIIALAFFVFSCYRRISFAALGRRGDKRTDHVGHRLLGMLKYGFAQKRIVQKPYGFNHLALFWSFVILLAANIEFVIKGINPAVTFMALPPAAYNVIYFIFDFFSLVALITVIIALIRRFVAPPFPKSRLLDAFVVLCLIAILMVAYFSLHGIEIEQGLIVVNMPVSAFVGRMFYAGLSTDAASSAMLAWWWTHAITFLFFLNYLPYSKHIHILTALFNVFFKSDDYLEMLQPETFTPDAHLGAGEIDEFTWKDLFDTYSCSECGRCQMNCPAYLTGKDLNPRLMIHEMKLNLNENGAALKRGEACRVPLFAADGTASINLETLWQCTTCGKCMEVCPMFIEHVPKIIEMRRNLVEMKADFPEELLGFFGNIEQRGNPWGIAPTERAKWYDQLGVKLFDESCEYLFYVGCAGSFDSRNQKIAEAIAHILNAAGVSWGVLGKDEPCCGESLRQLGNEFVFNRMATANVALFKERGVKKIITFCPHCFKTLDVDYRREFGLEAEVIHHTEFICQLITEGRLPLRADAADDGRIVYHDSCLLGRYRGIYDEPREVIARVTGSPPLEMERNREQSFCCGAGGGQMWLEEREGTRVNVERANEALKEKPDTVCVNCPFCMTMFEDGLKETDSGVAVKDLAEIVAERLA